MDGDNARFSDKVDENGGLLPFMLSRCWEWTWRQGQDGAFQGRSGDSRDN